jgi:glycosyltransferase involved in cell wall biosynthesis
VRISIVTPSYRSSPWLRLCIASVADQQAETEHIVQDAGSDDGTLDWLLKDPRVRAFMEKDQGMYDAVNRGFAKSSGDILAYLNCDEQYLPDTLKTITRYFSEHPDVDIVFGDVIMANPDGSYKWHRKMLPPLKYHTWTCHLSTLSCGTFFRRSLFFDRGFKFNPALRDVGDGEWMVRLLIGNVRMATLGQFTSVFTFTGTNMSVGANAQRENADLRHSAPAWARLFRPAWIGHHRLRRYAYGMYRQRPFSYSIYSSDSPSHRKLFQVTRPRSRRLK